MKNFFVFIVALYCGAVFAAGRTPASTGRGDASAAGVRNAATVSRTATRTPNASTTVDNRTARTPTQSATVATRPTVSSARATKITAIGSNTFGTGYIACRDAYFTCMDQFCAKQNDTYRRCVCSSRLADVQSRERALGQTADQLEDFKNLNLGVIGNTGAEVTAMQTATAGELAAEHARDTSDAAKSLSEIGHVLSKTKNNALSTLGTLDIAGNISDIWNTTDLAGGATIANLTGESLYNAVHSQCIQLVSDYCDTQSMSDMVVSAYGMYIENDCKTLLNSLDSKKTIASANIRETEREMGTARFDNYNAHNSSAINECVANVRSDLTTDATCGPDFVHCLDFTGLYLNRITGEPIYSADFYKLETALELRDDILTTPANQMVVTKLNNMRMYAENSLDKCRDIADIVWDNFMRQTIQEIYQAQQERVRTVKNTCLDVVNECYDEKSNSLKDFSNSDEQSLIGQRLELAEELCQTKMNTCTNLYGDVELLIAAMHNITDQKIAQNCRKALREYIDDICAVSVTDTLHNAPYGCRRYAPGEEKFATLYNGFCNNASENYDYDTDTDSYLTVASATVAPRPARRVQKRDTTTRGYTDTSNKAISPTNITRLSVAVANTQNSYSEAPQNYYQSPGTNSRICGDYINSLRWKLARYATQVCIRPSESDNPGYILPTNILKDINVVMDETRAKMSNELANECTRQGGVWIPTKYTGGTGGADTFPTFYNETAANTQWGYCANP